MNQLQNKGEEVMDDEKEENGKTEQENKKIADGSGEGTDDSGD